MKVTIADSLFLQYGKTAKLGGTNKDIPPTYFEWERSDPQHARFVTDADLKYAKGTGQIAWLLETFFLHPEDYLTAMQKPFDYVLTHNAYFAQNKNWLWYPHGGSFVPFEQWGVRKDKPKKVSMLCSPKEQLWGHKKFHEIAERFGDRVDVYGLDGYVDKLTALRDYQYSIVVEAEINRDFFSEKLLDCFALGTVPIYWGCPNIRDHFRSEGLICVDSISELLVWLDVIEERSYPREIIRKYNFDLAKQYRIPEDWIFNHYPFLFEVS